MNILISFGHIGTSEGHSERWITLRLTFIDEFILDKKNKQLTYSLLGGGVSGSGVCGCSGGARGLCLWLRFVGE